MFEIDSLLASTFSKYLIENLGIKVKIKVEQIIFEKYDGKTFEDAVANFKIMEQVLNQLYGDGYKGIIIGLLNQICIIEKSEKTNEPEKYRITIEDKMFFNKMLTTMQDHDKKMILQHTFPTPLTTSEIVTLVGNNSKKEIWKKIDSLIHDRFLVPTKTNNSNSTQKYSSTISETKIVIEHGKAKMSVLFTLPLKSSKLLRYIQNN